MPKAPKMHKHIGWIDPRVRQAESLRVARERAEKKRETAATRGYNREWYKLRTKVILERGCVCEFCNREVFLNIKQANGDRRLVANVDHIDGNSYNNDLNNLRVLCHSCHSRRTAQDQGLAYRSKSTVWDIF